MTPSTSKPEVILFGASGRMGRAIAKRFLDDGKIKLVGAVDSENIGTECGKLAGAENPGPEIYDSYASLPADLSAEIVVDFSVAAATRQNIEQALQRGWDIIIGTTGFNTDDLANFSELAGKYTRRIVLVPNFTLGINLLMKFVREAAKVIPNVEIIEMHHEKKADAPSGTALHTAKLIENITAEPSGTTDDRSRGRIEAGVPIHAVRLPGLLAHQEVIFGSEGEVLRMRHDTTDRSAFLTGIYLAVEKISTLPPGFTTGLDWAF